SGVGECLVKPKPKQFGLDGEIVVPVKGRFSFDDLLMRIHPAASRIQKLAKETPARLIVFELVVDDKGKDIVDEPLSERRKKLDAFMKRFFPTNSSIELSKQTSDFSIAEGWL